LTATNFSAVQLATNDFTQVLSTTPVVSAQAYQIIATVSVHSTTQDTSTGYCRLFVNGNLDQFTYWSAGATAMAAVTVEGVRTIQAGQTAALKCWAYAGVPEVMGGSFMVATPVGGNF
jgi:hypothetical protein